MNGASHVKQHELSAEAKALAKRLGSRDAEVRYQAAQQIREMGTAGRDILIAIMRHEEQQRRFRREQFYIRLVVYAVLFGIPALWLYFKVGTWGGFSMMVGNVTGGLIGSIAVTLRVTRAHNKAAYLLAKHFEDVSLIGPLAEALEYQSKSVREAAAEALKRLLPRVQSSDSDLLNTEQRSRLYRALMGRDPELVLAVLRALEQVGDSKAIPPVEKLAAGLGAAAEDQHLQDVAQQTLLLLRQRIELQSAPQTLLRAAREEGGALLRAASGSGGEEATVLLRPTSIEKD